MSKRLCKQSKKENLIFDFMTKKDFISILIVCSIATAWLFWLLIMIRKLIV